MLVVIYEYDFRQLQAGLYPSLFSWRTSNGILFGPASLLNHACNAELAWTNPTRRGVADLFEGFNCLHVKKKRAKKAVVFEAGDEICVTYGMSRKDFECKCGGCSSKKKARLDEM